jgi:hypothetical protein
MMHGNSNIGKRSNLTKFNNIGGLPLGLGKKVSWWRK